MNVDVGYDSWRIVAVRRGSCKCYPVGVMASAHKRFTIAICRAWNFLDLRPGWFLDLDNVEVGKGFEDDICDERVLANVLRKDS